MPMDWNVYFAIEMVGNKHAPPAATSTDKYIIEQMVLFL